MLENTHSTNESKDNNPLWRSWDQKSLKEGQLGTVFSVNGDKYKGGWLNNKKEGYGVYTWKDGSEYEGEWHNDARSGKGEYYVMKARRNGSSKRVLVYSGEWKNNQMQGIGKYYFDSGDVYEGEWYQNQRHGNGKHYYLNGDVYEGEWKQDHREGVGKLLSPNGNYYYGSWQQDEKNGNGTYYYIQPPRKYEGVWVKGVAVCGSLSDINSGEGEGFIPVCELVNPDGVLQEQVDMIQASESS